MAMLFIAQGALACEYPQRVDMPDGASATKDEMIAGQRDVKKYMANMETYLACIEAEEAQAVIQLGEIDDETARGSKCYILLFVTSFSPAFPLSSVLI